MKQSDLKVSYEGEIPWLQLGGDLRFRWVKVEVPVAGLRKGWGGENGFKFVFLTDVHLRRRWEPILDGVIRRIKESGARMVVFGGDFVDDKHDHRPAIPFVKRMLREIGTELGTYGVTGNHDGPKLAPRLAGEPVRLIVHERVEVAVGGGDVIELIGLAGHKSKLTTPEIIESFPAKRSGMPRVVVSHFPSLVKGAGVKLRPDLFLAGHTHGGQICMPGGRIIISHDKLPKSHGAGVCNWKGTPMVVSRGLGFSHWEIRTWCPPEVHEITLVAKG